MSREEAISILERAAHTESKWPGTEDTLEALDMAISALRQQETVTEHHELNEPLTLDELRQMDGEPVWVEFQDGSGGCWGLVHITMFNHVVFTHVVFTNGLYCTVGKPYYGKTWLAYRQKPEEGTV